MILTGTIVLRPNEFTQPDYSVIYKDPDGRELTVGRIIPGRERDRCVRQVLYLRLPFIPQPIIGGQLHSPEMRSATRRKLWRATVARYLSFTNVGMRPPELWLTRSLRVGDPLEL